MSNRKLITASIVADLKKINKSTSPYNPAYEFKTDLHNNVYGTGFKFIDEINDFPSIYVVSGMERRIYQTNQLTESLVKTAIRCYVYGEDAQQQTNDIIQDVEHIIYNMKPNVELLIQDITINEILTDSGLLEPYGMAEIFLNTRFEIYNN
jgi:hypothetical protein